MKLRRMDETGPFALAAVQQAMTEAGYTPAPDGDDRAGVVLGTYSAGGQATDDYLAALFKGGPTGAPALLFNSTVGNAAAGLAGLEFKLRGPNATISQKEASGLAAIATAVDLLRAGRGGRRGRRRHGRDLPTLLPRARPLRGHESDARGATAPSRRSIAAGTAS